MVEVLGRSIDEQSTRVLTREPLTGVFGSRATTAKVVVARLSVGGYSTDLIGVVTENDFAGGLWTMAAGRVAGQLESWIKTNRSQLQ